MSPQNLLQCRQLYKKVHVYTVHYKVYFVTSENRKQTSRQRVAVDKACMHLPVQMTVFIVVLIRCASGADLDPTVRPERLRVPGTLAGSTQRQLNDLLTSEPLR